jgi:hypothetical protein
MPKARFTNPNHRMDGVVTVVGTGIVADKRKTGVDVRRWRIVIALKSDRTFMISWPNPSSHLPVNLMNRLFRGCANSG